MGPLTRLCHCDTEAGSTAIIAQHHDKVRPVIRRFGTCQGSGWLPAQRRSEQLRTVASTGQVKEAAAPGL